MLKWWVLLSKGEELVRAPVEGQECRMTFRLIGSASGRLARSADRQADRQTDSDFDYDCWLAAEDRCRETD